jgi:hypothetical protein
MLKPLKEAIAAFDKDMSSAPEMKLRHSNKGMKHYVRNLTIGTHVDRGIR